MTCNKPLAVELTCEEIAGVIYALGPHSGAAMNVVSQKLEKVLDDHNKTHPAQDK